MFIRPWWLFPFLSWIHNNKATNNLQVLAKSSKMIPGMSASKLFYTCIDILFFEYAFVDVVITEIYGNIGGLKMSWYEFYLLKKTCSRVSRVSKIKKRNVNIIEFLKCKAMTLEKRSSEHGAFQLFYVSGIQLLSPYSFVPEHVFCLILREGTDS